MENIDKKNILAYKDIFMECHDDLDNVHKFYCFHVAEPLSSFFEVQYGRIGKNPVTKDYHRHDLWRKINEKLKKGYEIIKIRKFNLGDINFDEFVQKFIGEDCFLPEK